VAKLESLSDVGIYVRDQKKAKEFYVRKLGLTVRRRMPEFGYLALGATQGGEDASLNLWQPNPATWGEDYDAAVSSIGTVTGIGFRTTNLEKTLETLKRRKVPVEGPGEEGEGRIVRITDPDGNVVFAFEPPKPKVRRVGLSALDFITVVSRDAARAGEFFTKGLGMRGRATMGEEFKDYRLGPRGTALAPFTPTRDMYEDPSDYDRDMAHVGEDTAVMFRTRDIYTLQEQLMNRGVRFKQKAEKRASGRIEAKFFDADDNVYAVYQPEAPTRR